MSGITTHVLDTAEGRPAAGVPLVLERFDGSRWIEVGRGETDADGRQRALVPSGTAVGAGRYRMHFDTGVYFAKTKTTAFYPEVSVVFEIVDASAHYHVPLLLAPFGFSTYRGS